MNLKLLRESVLEFWLHVTGIVLYGNLLLVIGICVGDKQTKTNQIICFKAQQLKYLMKSNKILFFDRTGFLCIHLRRNVRLAVYAVGPLKVLLLWL